MLIKEGQTIQWGNQKMLIKEGQTIQWGNQKMLIKDGQTIQWANEKRQTTIYKTVYRKLKIEQHK